MQQEERRKLGRCYWRSLDIAVQSGFRSVVRSVAKYLLVYFDGLQAFPCISTGIYGYPNDDAADTVLKTVKRWLQEGSNDKQVRFHAATLDSVAF